MRHRALQACNVYGGRSRTKVTIRAYITVSTITALALSSSLTTRATIKPVRKKRFIEYTRKVKQPTTDALA